MRRDKSAQTHLQRNYTHTFCGMDYTESLWSTGDSSIVTCKTCLRVFKSRHA